MTEIMAVNIIRLYVLEKDEDKKLTLVDKLLCTIHRSGIVVQLPSHV